MTHIFMRLLTLVLQEGCYFPAIVEKLGHEWVWEQN